MAKSPKTRMNDNVRAAATKSLLRFAVLDRALVLAATSDRLATRVFQEMFTPEEHKLMKKVPVSWLSQVKSLNLLNAGGWRVELSFYGKMTREQALKHLDDTNIYYAHVVLNSLPQRLVLTPNWRKPSEDYVVKDAALAAEIQAFVQAKKTHEEETSNLYNQIASTVAGFRNLEDLLEAIPDLAAIAPDLKRRAIPAETALVLTAERLMCSIAKMRGDERDGCCDGERTADAANDTAVIAKAA